MFAKRRHRGRRDFACPRLDFLENRELLSFGALDPTFGTAGRVATAFPASAGPEGMALQPDGKIVVVGPEGDSNHSRTAFAVARYNTDGTLDSTFGSGGLAITDFGGSDDAPGGVAIQPDGNILVSGIANGHFAAARYTTAGALDPTFGTSGTVTTSFGFLSVTHTIPTVVLEPNGKFVEVGTANGDQVGLEGFNADGSVDTSFGTNGTVTAAQFGTDSVAGAVLQPDGDIAIAATAYGDKLQPGQAFLLRYTSAGNLETDVNIPLKWVTGVDVEPDGKLVLAGFTQQPLAQPIFTLVRLNADGSVDSSFGQGGSAAFNASSFGFSFALRLQPDGKIVVAGLKAGEPGMASAFALARFNPDGSPDTTFGVGAQVTTSFPGAAANAFVGAELLAIQPDGNIVAAGQVYYATGGVFPTGVFGLTRYGPVHSTAVTGADAGGGPEVRVFDPTTGAVGLDFYAYDPHFLGGVRVAMADLNGDGVPDVITGPGPSGGPDIRVFDGVTGQRIMEFMAYDPKFTGGVFVAVGDVNGDGVPDIITAPDQGGGSDVRVFDGKAGTPIQEFSAYDPKFRGGVRVAAADFNGDGRADIVTAPGPGGGPHIRIFEGLTGTKLGEFMAYDPAFLGGVYVAAGDVTGDGKPDVVTAPGQGGGPDVRVFAGSSGVRAQEFAPYAAGFQGGVRVAVIGDINGDGPAILTSPGPSGGPQAVISDPLTLSVLDSFYAYDPHFLGGVFVGGS